MFDYIEEHKTIFLIGAIVIIVGLLVTLVLINPKKDVTTTNTNSADALNEPDYDFLKDDISEEDKYLMLLGKILTEGYGTYSSKDTRGLQDVYNQATESFKPTIQEKIDSASKANSVSTTVDPDSIKLVRQSGQNILTMDAITNDNVKTKSEVVLIKEGDYWLVNNIIFK